MNSINSDIQLFWIKSNLSLNGFRSWPTSMTPSHFLSMEIPTLRLDHSPLQTLRNVSQLIFCIPHLCHFIWLLSSSSSRIQLVYLVASATHIFFFPIKDAFAYFLLLVALGFAVFIDWLFSRILIFVLDPFICGFILFKACLCILIVLHQFSL